MWLSLKSVKMWIFILFGHFKQYSDKRGEKGMKLIQRKQVTCVCHSRSQPQSFFWKHCTRDWKKQFSMGPQAVCQINFLLTKSSTRNLSQRTLYCWLWVELKFTCNCWLYTTHCGPQWMMEGSSKCRNMAHFGQIIINTHIWTRSVVFNGTILYLWFHVAAEASPNNATAFLNLILVRKPGAL